MTGPEFALWVLSRIFILACVGAAVFEICRRIVRVGKWLAGSQSQEAQPTGPTEPSTYELEDEPKAAETP